MRLSQSAPLILVAHPGSDLYGADLQLVESVAGLVTAGMSVIVVTPEGGPLDDKLAAVGAAVEHRDFTVLRKSLMSPLGMLKFAWQNLRLLPSIVLLLRRSHADVLYVNTITIPIWNLASAIARVKTLCHVHEVEDTAPQIIQRAITSQLNFATAIIVNSKASERFVRNNIVRQRRISLVYNGVPKNLNPRIAPESPTILYTGRLSPRKGVDTLVEAFAQLIEGGYKAKLLIAGSAYPGYEWYVDQLRAITAGRKLNPLVDFLGYRSDIDKLLTKCTVAVVPSRFEPFGNTAVEAQMAGIPLVCSRTQGLIEIAEAGHAVTFEPGDVGQLCEALTFVIDNPTQAGEMANKAKIRATEKFSQARYQSTIAQIVARLVIGK